MDTLLQILIGALLQGSLYTLGAFGLSLSFGVLRILNLSHGDFLMLGGFGGYFVFVLTGLNPFIALLLIAFVAFFAGIAYYELLISRLLGRPFRHLLVASVIITLGTSMIIEDATSYLWGGGSVGIPYRLPVIEVGGLVFPMMRFIPLIGTLLLTIGLHYFLTRTFLGRAIMASTINREGALVVGIDIDTISRITFALGVALAAGTGVLYAALYTTEPFMGLNLTLKYLAVIIIGGAGSLPGAFLGGLAIAVSEGFASFYLGAHWSPMIAFALLVLALLVRPQGLLGKGIIEI
jgi:branched-chain amino acid transport system permease protein